MKRHILNSRVIADLKSRSSIGIIVYMVLAVIVVGEKDFYHRNSGFALAFVVAMNGIGLIRFTHLWFFNRLERLNEKFNTVFFVVTVLLTSMIWGTGFAYFMTLAGDFNARLLMAICTAGLCSGGVVAFIPDRRISLVYNLLMLLPAVILMVVKGTYLNLAMMIVLFSGYMMMLTFRGSREYWDALENEKRLKEKTVELKRLSHTDPLTGLYNRRYFNEIFDYEWKHCCRDKTMLTVVICDIDYFKQVNDTLGHIAGDEYLVSISKILRSTFKRDTDIVARYGGEEFVMLLSGLDDAQAFSMTEELRQTVSEHSVMFNGVEIRNTLSFGIASCVPDNQTSQLSLIARADRALYRAKDKGRNRVEVETPASREAGVKALPH